MRECFCPTLLLLALALCAGVCAQQVPTTPYDIEVCVDASWRSVAFLKGPSDKHALDNVTHWTTDDIKVYAKEKVIPQVLPNAVFVGMAVLALLIFLLWRIIRQCCLCCCMKQSCAEKRESRNPHEVLSGWRFWVLKGVLLVVAVAAWCFMIAGLATAKRHVVSGLWEPVDRLSGFMGRLTNSSDGLLASLDGVDPILDNLTAIAQNDVNITGLQASLRGIDAFLSDPNLDPTAMYNRVKPLSDGVASLKLLLAATQANLAAAQPDLATLNSGLGALSQVVSPTLQGYSDKLTDLKDELALLTAAAGPAYDTTGLRAAVAAVTLPTWVAELAGLISTLDVWRRLKDSNAFGTLARQLSDAIVSANSLQQQIDPTVNSVTNFANQWPQQDDNFVFLFDRVDIINRDVVVLEASTMSSVGELRNLTGQIGSTVAQVGGVTSDLDTLRAQLDSVSGLSGLQANLQSVASAMGQASSSDIANAMALLTAVRDSFAALRPELQTTSTALTAYVASGESDPTDFATLKDTVTGATGNTAQRTTDALAAVVSAMSDPTVIVADAAAGQMQGPMGAVVGGLPAAASTLSAVSGALDAYGDTSAILGPLQEVQELYGSSPTPKEQLADVRSTVDDIDQQISQTPADVRREVASAKSGFQDGVGDLKDKVVKRVDDFRYDWEDDLDKYDTYRYQATCALYGVMALVLLVFIVVVAINCPWGIGCSIFFLLLLLILLFLLAAAFAVALVGLQEGCYHSEAVVLEIAGGSKSTSPSQSSAAASGSPSGTGSGGTGASGAIDLSNVDPNNLTPAEAEALANAIASGLANVFAGAATANAAAKAAGAGTRSSSAAAGGEGGGSGPSPPPPPPAPQEDKSKIRVLLEYYMFGSSTVNISTVLKDAGIVDVDEIKADVTSKVNETMADIRDRFTPQRKLNDTLNMIDPFIQTVLAGIDAVLAMAGVQEVQPIYISLKEFPCCDVADVLATGWLIFTFGGWLVLATCCVGMGFLSVLDRLPQSGCMGCRPLLLSRLDAQVHPEGGSQGRAKGDDGDVEKAVVLDPNAPPPHQAMGQGGYPGPQQQQQPYGAPTPGYDPYAAGGAYAANQYATSPTGVDPTYGGAYGGYPPAQPYDPYGAPPPQSYDPYGAQQQQPYGYGGQQPYGQEAGQQPQQAAPAFGQPQQQQPY